MRLGVVMPIASVAGRLLPRNWITAVTPDKEIWPHHTPVNVDYLVSNSPKMYGSGEEDAETFIFGLIFSFPYSGIYIFVLQVWPWLLSREYSLYCLSTCVTGWMFMYFSKMLLTNQINKVAGSMFVRDVLLRRLSYSHVTHPDQG